MTLGSGDTHASSRRSSGAGRLVATLASLIVVATALAGCGGASQPDGTESARSAPSKSSLNARPTPTPTITLTAESPCEEVPRIPLRNQFDVIESTFGSTTSEQTALVIVLCSEAPPGTTIQSVVDSTTWATPPTSTSLTVAEGTYAGYSIGVDWRIRRVAMTSRQIATELDHTTIAGGFDGGLSVRNTTPSRPFPVDLLARFAVYGSYPAGGPVCALVPYLVNGDVCTIPLGTVTPDANEIAGGSSLTDLRFVGNVEFDVPDASIDAIETAIELPRALALVWVQEISTRGTLDFTTSCAIRGSSFGMTEEKTVLLTAPANRTDLFC